MKALCLLVLLSVSISYAETIILPDVDENKDERVAGMFDRNADMRTVASEDVIDEDKNWYVNGGAGLTLNRGNIEQTGGYLNLTGAYRKEILGAYVQGNYGYSEVGGSRYSHKALVIGRGDYFLNDAWRVFAFSTHAFNEFLLLDYRTSNGVGPWFDFETGDIKNGVSLCVAYEHEKFTALGTEDAWRLSFRNLFSWKITDMADVGFDFYYVPAFSDFADYRLYLAPFIQTKIWKDYVGLKYQLSWDYDTMPKTGIEKSDIEMTVFLTFNLGK